jgi:Glycosyl hydrolases family 43
MNTASPAARSLGLLCGLVLAAGCSGGGGGPAAGSGGASATGGTPATGGMPATGGTPATGGAPWSGGPGGGGAGGTATGGAGIAGRTGNAGHGGAAAGGRGGAAGAPGTGGAGTAGSPGAQAIIHNDVFWKDTAGNPIYSQGGGVLKVGATYYWYGVRYGGAATYAANPSSQNSDTSFVAIPVYSSTDLASWKLEGNALTYASVSAKLAMTSSTWIGRVGAAYNATTKKVVLVGQYQGSPDTQQFFATSDTPAGPFSVDHAQPTITNVANNNCGDEAVFNDDDGQAYIVCSNLSGRSNIYVIPLRPADFLEAQPATRIYNGSGREGNAMFKVGNRYFACSSDLHGWNASHTYCISATNIMGPYGAEVVMENTDLDFSHVSQTGLFITVKGTTQDLVIFGGDRWSDFAGNGVGYNQWVPLTFDGATPVMQSLSAWSIDAAAGTWAIAPGNNFVLNPSFEADRVATNPPAGWTTTAGADVTSTHTGNFAWQLSNASAVGQKIAGLPAGTYTLSVWVKGTATGTLYAKGCGAADQSVALSGGTSWTQVSLPGIAATGGACEVGATATSGTATLDDFSLTKN